MTYCTYVCSLYVRTCNYTWCRLHSITYFLRRESTIILKGGLVRAFGLAFMIVSITIMTFILFSVYTSIGGVLTPKIVFTVLSLIIILRLTSVPLYGSKFLGYVWVLCGYFQIKCKLMVIRMYVVFLVSCRIFYCLLL